MNKINKSQQFLLSVNCLKVVLDLFIGTFLTSYIVQQTPDSILGQGLFNIGLLYLSWNFFYAVFDFLFSFYVDKGNHSLFLRIGIAINTLLIVALVFWGETISKWIVLAGFICGLSDALYYSSYHVLRTELGNNKESKQYHMLITIMTNVIKVVVPVIMGYLIDISTYSTIAIYVIFICLGQFVLSLFIKSEKIENSKFEPKKYIHLVKTNKEFYNNIKYTYFNALIAGVKTTYKIIVIVITVYIFKKNLSLGIYTSIFSLITILFLIAYKYVDDHTTFNKLPIYLFLGFLPFAACIVMLIKTTEFTLMALNLTLLIVSYFSDYLGTLERDEIIRLHNKPEFIAEHQVLCENMQVGTRLIAYGIFMLVGLSANLLYFKIMLFVFIALNPLKFMVMYKQRKIRKQMEANLQP